MVQPCGVFCFTNTMTFIHSLGDRYVVTGLLYNSARRFKIQTVNPSYALGINLWRGNVWRIPAGQTRRIKIKSVFN